MEIIKKYYNWLLVAALLIIHFIPKGAIKDSLGLALWIILIPLLVFKIIKGFNENDTKGQYDVIFEKNQHDVTLRSSKLLTIASTANLNGAIFTLKAHGKHIDDGFDYSKLARRGITNYKEFCSYYYYSQKSLN